MNKRRPRRMYPTIGTAIRTTTILLMVALLLGLLPASGLLSHPPRALAQTVPNLLSFTSSTADGTYGNGEPVEICANYDQVIETGSTLDVTLDTGTALTLNHFDESIDGAISVDGTFAVGAVPANQQVNTVVQQPDGKILLGGTFTQINGTAMNRIARLNADGSLDTSFVIGSGANNFVTAIALQSDGKIIISGAFALYNGNSATKIARLNTDGSFDASFNVGAGLAASQANAIVVQPDDKIILGGSFTLASGTSRNRVARLNADGSLDTSFDPGTGANNVVNGAALQPDGKILIGGNFTQYNGTARNRIARLNADGSLDTSFVIGAGATHPVSEIVVQPDGKILLAGSLLQYDGTNSLRIVRVNADGSRDTSFVVGAGANNVISALTLQSNGKILIGGNFTQYDGTNRARIARLNTDGSLDTTFDPGGGAGGTINAFGIQPDGKVLIGGNFLTFDGTSIFRFARLTGDANTPKTPDQQLCGTYSVIPDDSSSDLTVAAITSANVTSFDGGNSTATAIPAGQNLDDNANLVVKSFSPGGVGDQLGLWLAANKGTNGVADGALLSQWNDISGGGIIAENSTAATQPTYRDNATDNMNGNPVVEFDGAGDLLNLPDGTTPSGPDSYTIIAVYQAADGETGTFYGGGVSLNGNGFSFGVTTNSAYAQGWVGAPNNLTSPTDSRTPDLPSIATFRYDSSFGRNTYDNGESVAENTTVFIADFDASLRQIGIARNIASTRFAGDIAEVIAYSQPLTYTQQQKVESYLAIKYGITQSGDNDGDATTFEAPNEDGVQEGDYVSTSGAVIWDASANSAYYNNVAGIGRDDDGGLDQQASKSISSDAIVSVSNGGAFSTDRSYLVWGHNGLDGSAWLTDTVATGTPSGRARIEREWLAQVTGSVTNVTLQVDVDDPEFDLPEVLGALFLVVDEDGDGDFSNAIAKRMMPQGGGIYAISGLTLVDGQRFTFGAPGPGIRGTVFIDHNANGELETGEPGLGGIVVTAIDAAGITSTTVTAADGSYLFLGDVGFDGPTIVRFDLPADGSLDSYQSTVFGPSSPSTVQIVRVGQSWAIVNAGFTSKEGGASCDEPIVALGCNVPGTGGDTTGLLSFPYLNGPFFYGSDAETQDIGAIWGSGMDSGTSDLYNAALLKRHVGLGPLAARNGNDVTVDGVYQLSYSTGVGVFNPAAPGFTLHGVTPSTGPQIDLGTVRRDLDDNELLDNDYELLSGQSANTKLSVDLDAYAKAGTVGFGNIDVNFTDKALWLVNLNQRSLIRVDRASGGVPTNGSAVPGALVSHYPITDPGCNGGDFRPWALTIATGVGYVGVSCSAETSQNTADLAVHILTFDPANPGAGFATELTFPLNYMREAPVRNFGAADPGNWQPWTNTWPAALIGRGGSYPQPILADIEFDRTGAMILGFMDRWGQQTRKFNLEAKPLAQNPAKKLEYMGAGDLIHVCNTNGSWEVEGTGSCLVDDWGGVLRLPIGSVSGPEYYAYEEGNSCTGHVFIFEATMGGICMGPGGDNVMVPGIASAGEGSPAGNNTRNTGIRVFDTLTGKLWRGGRYQRGYITKFSNALGCADDRGVSLSEPSCFCLPGPVEIGNRVWLDANLNGIQDPSEAPLAGVAVEIIDAGGGVIGTATTDARGEYYFSSAPGTDAANALYNLSIPGSGVSVRINNLAGQAPLNGLIVTSADQGSSDLVDSDATLSGGAALIPVNTAGGRVDHTYDFGFAPDVWDVALRKTVPVQYVAPGTDVVFTIELFNQGFGPVNNLQIIDYIPAEMTLVDGNWTAAGANATRTLVAGNGLPANGLLPGESVSVQITLRVNGGLADNTSITNKAEVAAVTDMGGNTFTDEDSTPDSSDGDLTVDDIISDDGTTDEDDHDIAVVIVTAQTDVYDLALRKTVGKQIVVENEEVPYTIQLFNQGTEDAANVVIVDRYPTGFSLTAGQPDWTDVGGTEATYTIASLPAGESVSIPIVLTAGATLGNLDNYAEIKTDDGADVDSQPEDDESDANGDNLLDDIISDDGTTDEDDHDIASLTVIRFDLAIRKQLAAGEPTTTVAGADVNFVIDVFNQGSVDAFDISIIDYLPTGMLLSPNDIGGWADTGEGIFNAVPGPLRPDESERLTITLRVSDTATLGPIVNTVEIATASDAPAGPPAADADSTPDSANNNDGAITDDELDNANGDEDDHDIATLTVGEFDLALRKTYRSDGSSDGLSTDGIVGVGEQITFTVEIFNQGDVPAYDIEIFDRNPNGIFVDDSVPVNLENGWLVESPLASTNYITGPLNPDDSITRDIVLYVVGPNSILWEGDPTGQHENLAEITGASNVLGGPQVVDIDSTPDNDVTNDGTVTDNEIDNGGGDQDDHDPAPFDVRATFDLAVIKYPVFNEDPRFAIPSVQPGDVITFEYFVENQGTLVAQDIELIEHVQPGLILNDSDWTPSNVTGPGTAMRTLPGTLAPGESFTDTVIFTIGASIEPGKVFTNVIEIASANQQGGAPGVDVDSNPDTDPDNEIFIKDDYYRDNFRVDPLTLDEDDHDIAIFATAPEQEVAITKTLRSVGPFVVGAPLIYDIRIENVGQLPISTVPLTDTYDTDYLSYNTLLGATPSPDALAANDGQLNWSDVTGSGTFAVGDVMTVTVNFFAAGDTSALDDDTSCANSGAGETVNVATVMTQTSCVGIAITPQAGKSTLGDFVWYDEDADGIKDTGEEGIDGVRVELYEVVDLGGGITETQFITFQITGPDRAGINSDDTPTYGDAGAYDFLVPDNKVYQVVITDTNFLPGGTLENYIYTGEVSNPDEVYSGPNPRTVVIGFQVDHNDADFPFTLPPQLAVGKTLNGDNPFVSGVDISFTIVVTNSGPVTLTVVPLEDRYNSVFLEYKSASVPPSAAGPGVLAWSDLTTALGNIAPGATISLTVTFETLADTTLLQPVAPCTGSGHTPNIVEIDGALADPDGDDGVGDDVAVVQDTDDHDCAEVQILNPTAVQLAERSISQTPDGVLVRWSTVSESDFVGFHIWKSNGTEAQLRNNEMIVAANAGLSSGASYEWLDAGATLRWGDAYVLEIVRNDGSVERTVIGVVSGEEIFLPLVAK